MNRPAHFMVSEGTGDLFDTRAADWHKRPPLRPAFERHFKAIESAAEFKATIRAGGFTWPGAYPLALVCHDGGLLCFDCGRKEARQILDSIRTDCRDGWRVVACDICHAEEAAAVCDHCGQTIAEGPEEEEESPVYVGAYFAQGEEGAAACEELDNMGAAAWVSMMSGAIDFREGDTSPAPPWGSSDRLAYESPYDGGTLRVHVNDSLAYVGITLELKESE